MVVAALALVQIVGGQDANPRRVEREIEIMAGILETTLRFALEESSEKRIDTRLVFIPRDRSKSVRGYYLEDQGVAFVVKTGRAASRGLGDASIVEFKFDSIEFKNRFGQGDVQVELDKRLVQRQADVKARIERMQARTDTLKKHLVEALANHGDSMTIVGEDEYLNLILEPDSSPGLMAGVVFGVRNSAAVRSETLTVRKSWITDYKAGRLTMAEFKQKVLRY